MISSIKRRTDLSFARILACMGIIILHTVFAANEYYLDRLSETENLLSRIIENNMMWAVPFFVMVTGTLQLDPGKNLTLKKLYGRYVLRILLALVACCVLFRLFDMIADGESFTLVGILQAFTELLTARCWGHLWYLYLLIGLYVLLPFYRMIAKHSTNREILYLLAAYVLFVSIIPIIEDEGIHIGFYISESIIYPAYLFLGYIISSRRLRIEPALAVGTLILATIAILTLDIGRYGYGMEISDQWFGYASPLVIIQATAFFSLIVNRPSLLEWKSKWLEEIDRCTFGVYLIHMIFIRLLFRYMEFNPYEYMAPLSMIIVIIVNSLLSLAVVFLIRSITVKKQKRYLD